MAAWQDNKARHTLESGSVECIEENGSRVLESDCQGETARQLKTVMDESRSNC
jgi:hypothetical protein